MLALPELVLLLPVVYMLQTVTTPTAVQLQALSDLIRATLPTS